jgi:hypothetical protein
VLKAIKLREQQRDEVQHALSRLDLQTVAPLDVSALRPRITALLADMRGLAGRHVQATRQLLRKLLVGRLTFSPDVAQRASFASGARARSRPSSDALNYTEFKDWWPHI